jgi:hypothetical protein
MSKTNYMYTIAADFTVEVPAGKYWLCDPCYAVDSELWDALLDSCAVFDLPVGTVKKNGQKYQVLGFRTAYGDGVYRDQAGNSFPVDAGLIGLTPVELTDGHPFGATLVEFKTDTECSCSNGVLRFGTHTINTKDD